MAALSTKTRMTKVLTGITEDYCYKKTKTLVLLSPALGNRDGGHQDIAKRQKSAPREGSRPLQMGGDNKTKNCCFL
jgi:hypothetical protein